MQRGHTALALGDDADGELVAKFDENILKGPFDFDEAEILEKREAELYELGARNADLEIFILSKSLTVDFRVNKESSERQVRRYGILEVSFVSGYYIVYSTYLGRLNT